MGYVQIKGLHVVAVVVSVAGFVLRYVLSLYGNGWRRYGLLRVGPHVVDSVLLASAIWLSVLAQQYPFVDGWLTAKVIALVVYIVAGSVALRYGRTAAARTGAFALALISVAFIIGAATRKSPWGWF